MPSLVFLRVGTINPRSAFCKTLNDSLGSTAAAPHEHLNLHFGRGDREEVDPHPTALPAAAHRVSAGYLFRPWLAAGLDGLVMSSQCILVSVFH